MNCSGRAKTFMTAMLILLVLMICSFTGCSEKAKNAATPEEAISAYLDVERGESIELENLDHMVVKIFPDDDICYYLMKDNVKGGEVVYVLGVAEKEGRYICTKESADFSLEPDDDPLVEHNAIIYQIPVKDFYINVGKIYQERHEAYFKNEKIEKDRNGIFAVKTHDGEAEVEVEYVEN